VELNWTTFGLEILNFLVLVWILQHFLYRPVFAVIAARRAGIEKTMADAKVIDAEVQELKSRYEKREAEWQQETERARASLAQEIAAERVRLTGALESSLAEQRDRAKVLQERQREEWQRAAEQQAVDYGAEFAARLLARVATPALETGLIDAAMQDLVKLPADQGHKLASDVALGLTAVVTSAYPIDENRRGGLERLLAAITGAKLALDFKENPEILAGIHVDIGSWVVHANLRDELKFFSTAGQREA
jgi:F-type H+-transporting ATPase subunit b